LKSYIYIFFLRFLSGYIALPWTAIIAQP